MGLCMWPFRGYLTQMKVDKMRFGLRYHKKGQAEYGTLPEF